ncbi:hypothetical protein DFH08DRAFT_825928 [Mycena albidolilacea]|uniref:Uncharacterized protein n=1 Tax=Mycena albidolilacea TaxID=1033008 RepID=A0AAD6Z1U7_9AGAR|nr:hypothetical protein DFH08DRAFT_825928 [Mycena albidolilacea]
MQLTELTVTLRMERSLSQLKASLEIQAQRQLVRDKQCKMLGTVHTRFRASNVRFRLRFSSQESATHGVHKEWERLICKPGKNEWKAESARANVPRSVIKQSVSAPRGWAAVPGPAGHLIVGVGVDGGRTWDCGEEPRGRPRRGRAGRSRKTSKSRFGTKKRKGSAKTKTRRTMRGTPTGARHAGVRCGGSPRVAPGKWEGEEVGVRGEERRIPKDNVVLDGDELPPFIFEIVDDGPLELRAPLHGVAGTHQNGRAASTLRGGRVSVRGERIWRNVSQLEPGGLEEPSRMGTRYVN